MNRIIRAHLKQQQRWDVLWAMLGLIALLSAMLTLLVLFADLVIQGYARLDWAFMTEFPSRRAAQAGILSAWVGSMLIMLLTALIAIPIGVASAVYLEEYLPKSWAANVIEINIANLAGVPSIIYGLLALGLFVYGLNLGQSIITASLTLALLVLPVIIVTSREALRSIPRSIREAAFACGASRWQLVSHHLLPMGLPGILTGIILSLARAIGETAPIITIGALTFIAFLPPAPWAAGAGWFDWLQSPFTVMPIQIFNWTSRPEPAFHHNAAAASLVLIVMTLGMNALAIFIRYKLRKQIK
jgi:phosphate transport system permease protein